MENENINNSDETTARTCVGITGNSGNNDLAMAKLWVLDGVLKKIEIRTVGTDFLITRGKNAVRQLSGKTLNEIELYLDYSVSSAQREQPELDPVFEAIIRAMDDCHKPVEEFEREDSTSEPTPVVDVSESNDQQLPVSQNLDSGLSPE